MVDASSVARSTVFSTCIWIILAFIPTVIAFLKGNAYKFQTLKYQLILIVLSVIVSIVTKLLSSIGISDNIVVIISLIWSIASFVAWIYILIHAIKDTEMTFLQIFGINL